MRATRTRNLTRIKIMAEARKDAEWETMLLRCARDHVFFALNTVDRIKYFKYQLGIY